MSEFKCPFCPTSGDLAGFATSSMLSSAKMDALIVIADNKEIAAIKIWCIRIVKFSLGQLSSSYSME